MSKSKTAASAAKAKLCPSETISMSVDVVDIVDSGDIVIREFSSDPMKAGTIDGAWVVGDEQALQIASPLAAVDGLAQIAQEFGQADESAFAGIELDPESAALANLKRSDAARGVEGPFAFAVDPHPPVYD